MENPCWCNNTDAEADDVAVAGYGEPIVMLGLLWYEKIKVNVRSLHLGPRTMFFQEHQSTFYLL